LRRGSMIDYLKQNRVVLLSLSMIAVVACGGASAPEEEVMAEPVDTGNSHLVDLKLPNPNPEVITEWGVLPDGRSWGSTAGVDIGPDGHVWVYDRCGANGLDGGCEANPDVDPVLKYDRNTGEVLANFGAGLFVLPHGIHADDDGNVWVTDSQGNEAGTKGHQVIKFSPEGEVLLRLGEAGQPGTGPGQLNEPCDVITAPNGDIFVSDGHSGQNPDPPEGRTGRILKFDSEGNFIKEWGEIGFRPGQFRTPHALEFDSQGRLYVADRGNHRIQIFDQEGELLDIYYQYSRISGLFITADDTLYAIDSESQETNHYGWKDGVRIGPAGEDRLTGFIPGFTPGPGQPGENRALQGLAGEGVAVDADGNVFVAEGPGSRPFAGGGLTKYVVAN